MPSMHGEPPCESNFCLIFRIFKENIVHLLNERQIPSKIIRTIEDHIIRIIQAKIELNIEIQLVTHIQKQYYLNSVRRLKSSKLML